MDYFIHVATVLIISLLMTQSYNLVFGLGGIFHLAHIATFGLGAYVTAILTTESAMSVESALILSGIVGGLFSCIVAGIGLRLSSDYFALGTLALNSIVISLFINWKSLTRGVLGIPGIPRPNTFNFDYYQSLVFLGYVAVWSIILLLLLLIVFKSPIARSLTSLRDNKVAATTLGIASVETIFITLFIASVVIGISGGLFAILISFIDPTSFGFAEAVFILTAVVVGKPGSYWGCLISTAFLVILPEALRFADIPSNLIGPIRQLIYAVILYLVLLINRAHLFPPQRNSI